MKKKTLTILSLLLPTFILISFASGVFPALYQGEKTSDASIIDPFAAMYDADGIMLERLESVLAEFEHSSALEVASHGNNNTKSTSESSTGTRTLNQQAETMRTLARQGQVLEIQSMLPERLSRQVERIFEDTYENRYIIKYKNRQDVSRQMSGELTLSKYTYYESEKSGLFEVVTLPERVNPKTLADELRAAGFGDMIEYMQPDLRVYPAGLSLGLIGESSDPTEGNGDKEDQNEEGGESEDHEINEELFEIPDENTFEPNGLSEVIVAIIDTCVEISHPLIADNLWTNADDGLNGWNFYENSSVLYDPACPAQSSHGTHVAGVIAQSSGDNVKLMILPVFGPAGANTSDILDAITYAVEHFASVINCSFGSSQYNPALEEAMRNADALIVAAAGNGRSDLGETPVYPAAYRLDNLLSVGSVNDDGGFSYYSNYSTSLLDITAPGREIISAFPDGDTGPMTGTSMSAAYVTGVAAAVLSVSPDLTAEELRQRLLESSDRLSNLTGLVSDGRRCNLMDAIAGVTGKPILQNYPTDDFNVFGYHPTTYESWELYASSGKVVQVAAGEYFSLALKEDGTVWSWGSNYYGELGDGTYVHRASPAQVIGLTDVVYIAAGNFHSLAVKSDGTLWAWGCGYEGAIGDGNAYCTSNSIPIQTIGITGVTSVAAGNQFSVALRENGSVWWFGKLCSTGYEQALPEPVLGLCENIVDIAAGEHHVLLLDGDGVVWALGDNWGGQLGYDSDIMAESGCPVPVEGLSGAIAISAGSAHSLALRSDGSVYGWGLDEYGLTNTQDTDRFIAIGARSCENIGIKEDGTVWQWGLLYCGYGSWYVCDYPTQIVDITDIVSTASGVIHTLALKADGTVWAWGRNERGQLGDGTTIEQREPVHVFGIPVEVTPPDSDFKTTKTIQVSAGSFHTLVLKENGTVWAWGNNLYGQCGDALTFSETRVRQIVDLTDVIYISAGRYHSLAVKADGTVWAWGWNIFGALGDATTISKGIQKPVQVNGISSVAAVSAGSFRSIALKTDGTVWAWGSGALGDGSNVIKAVPVQVSNLTGVIDISAGDNYTLALKNNGTVWAWGHNDYGQLGDGTTTLRTTPVQVNGLTNVSSLDAGVYHNIAVRNDGTLWSWGDNQYGQLGDDTVITRKIPVQISGISGVIAVSAGETHSLAAKADGTVWAWGHNNNGQLGDGTMDDRLTPVKVRTLADVNAVSAGSDHSLCLKADGTVWVWGSNHYGQLGFYRYDLVDFQRVGGISNITAVSAGMVFTLALKADGTVWVWENDITTVDRVNGISGVTAVSSGDSHCLALKADGTVWSWGSNEFGQLGDGTAIDKSVPVQVSGISDVIAVSAGLAHSLALKADGTVWSWGSNGFEILVDGSTVDKSVPVQVSGISDVIAVSAGAAHSLALKADGTVWTWGVRDYNVSEETDFIYTVVPEQIYGISNVTAISASITNYALKSDGTVWTWGNTITSDLSFGEYNQSPVRVKGISDVTDIHSGFIVYAAIKKDGTVWGLYGTEAEHLPGILGAVSAKGGLLSIYVLKSDGTVWAMGLATLFIIKDEIDFLLAPIQARISGNIASSIALSLDTTKIEIPASGVKTPRLTAVVKNQFGEEMADALVTYSLAEATVGVTINASTGLITITPDANPGVVRFKATCGLLEATAALTLKLFFDNPAFELSFVTSANSTYTLSLTAAGLTDFDQTLTLTYDSALLELLDFAAQTGAGSLSVGLIEGTGMTILSHSPGELTFRVDRAIPEGQAWSGIVTILRFIGIGNGETKIIITE